MAKYNDIQQQTIDERIESFLRGTMTEEEEANFKQEIKADPHPASEGSASGRYRSQNSTSGLPLYRIVRCSARSFTPQDSQDLPPDASQLPKAHLQAPLNSKENITSSYNSFYYFPFNFHFNSHFNSPFFLSNDLRQD